MKTEKSSNSSYGKKITWVLAFSFFLPFLFLLASCQSEKILIDNSLDIKAEMGYDKTISLWRGNPVKFTITNAGADFKGELSVMMPVNYDQQYEIIIPIEVAAGSEKTIEKYIDINNVTKEFDYKLSSDGNLIKEGKLKVNKFLDPQIAKVAIIADKSDSYTFFNNMNLGKDTDLYYQNEKAISTAEAEAIPVGKEVPHNFVVYLNNMENFSDDDALMFFDFIFVGDTTNLKLTDKGIENLTNWIHLGGVLIIEAGDNFEKVNAMLPDSLRQVDFKNIEEYNLNELDPDGTGIIKLAKGNVLRKGVKEINILNNTLGYVESIGKGKLVTINTLLNNKEIDKVNQNGSFLAQILNTVQAKSTLTLDYEYNAYNFAPYVVDNIPNSAELPFELIGIILACYAIIATPVLYLILKKMDKRNLMWIVAPATAILVIFTISQIGSYVWGNKPILNEASVITYIEGSDSLDVNSRLGLFNNQKSDMKITWNGKQNIKIDYTEYYNYYEGNDFKGNRKTVSSMYLQNNPLLYSYNTKLWENMKGSASKSIEFKDKGTNISIKSDGNKQLVKFKNGLPMDFKDTILYWGSKYYLIGDIKSGEEIELDLKTVYSTDDLYNYDIDTGHEPDYESYEIINQLTNRNLDFDEVDVFASNTDPIGYEFEINDKKPKEFARNLIYTKLNLQLEKGAHITLTEHDTKFDTYSTMTDREKPELDEDKLTLLEFYGDRNYKSASMVASSYKANSTVTEFKLPDDITINSIEIDFNNTDENTIYEFELDVNTINDRYFIYNYQENKYEELNFEKQGYEDYTLPKLYTVDEDKYISKTNMIKIKVLKPVELDGRYYDVKPHGITIEGVYND